MALILYRILRKQKVCTTRCVSPSGVAIKCEGHAYAFPHEEGNRYVDEAIVQSLRRMQCRRSRPEDVRMDAHYLRTGRAFTA